MREHDVDAVVTRVDGIPVRPPTVSDDGRLDTIDGRYALQARVGEGASSSISKLNALGWLSGEGE